jgi:hypothetical protein
MSHFSVLVCLPGDTDPAKVETALSEIMQPWDEGRAVEPWRDYADGGPGEFWWVSSVRRGAAHYRDGTGILPHDPDGLGLSNRASQLTEAQQRAEFARDAKRAEQLGEHPTWEAVVRMYNETYGHGTALATTDDDSDSERMHYDPEIDRAYTISTRNPDAKWDYWSIGGRWGGYFPVKQAGPGLLWGSAKWDSPKEVPAGLRADGGPLALLDLDVMRADAEREAHERYDKWEEICRDTPVAKGWDHFGGLAKVGTITLDTARAQYRAQPRIVAADRVWGPGSGCPVEEFMSPREEYVAEARRGAVPGYALVTLEREWVAPGKMGWFAMSSDGPGERSSYRVAVNTYLDQLDPATVLVALDCHI